MIRRLIEELSLQLSTNLGEEEMLRVSDDMKGQSEVHRELLDCLFLSICTEARW